ncbi:hypothetical protein V1512DRAFT_255726 [Lipomyces arxii]|uniref:uncharacterized protein n=1 Tax=Lipomyces arxii TaxID=56418 RepID=UPI0034CE951E
MRFTAAARSKLTTSLFSTTFFIAIFTVAAPSIFPCPATRYPVGADSGELKIQDKKVVLASRNQTSIQKIVSKNKSE